MTLVFKLANFVDFYNCSESLQRIQKLWYFIIRMTCCVFYPMLRYREAIIYKILLCVAEYVCIIVCKVAYSPVSVFSFCAQSSLGLNNSVIMHQVGPQEVTLILFVLFYTVCGGLLQV